MIFKPKNRFTLSEDRLIIDAEGTVDVSVYDVTGRLILTSSQKIIPLTAKGFLLAKVKTGKEEYVGKIINK